MSVSGDELQNEAFPDSGTRWFQTIEASEDYQSQNLQVSLNGGTASVVLRCRWEDRFDVVHMALEGGTGAMPAVYPFESELRGGDTGSPWYASGVSVVPAPSRYEADGESIEYQYAMITITYTQMTTEISFDSTGTFMTINPSGIYWKLNGAGAAIAAEEAPGLFIPSHDLTLSHPHMRITWNDASGTTLNISDFEGTCNASDVTLQANGYSRTYPAETLCCSSPSLKGGCNLSGSAFFAVSLKLSYNPLTHNKWYHPKQELAEGAENSIYNRSVEMYSDAACTVRFKPVPTRDFAPLFRVFGVGGNG